MQETLSLWMCAYGGTNAKTDRKEEEEEKWVSRVSHVTCHTSYCVIYHIAGSCVTCHVSGVT